MKNSNFEDFEEFLYFMESKNFEILELANRIDELYWTIEKEGITREVVKELRELVNSEEDNLRNIYKTEGYIYSELTKVLPKQSSVNAFISENESILKLLITLKNLINSDENLKPQKDILQAEIIAMTDVIYRNINKKENMMFHEARTMLGVKNHEAIVTNYNLTPVYFS